jgi:hypothetical protein
MSTHGMIEMVQDHPTYRKVDGHWKSFKYMESFLHYCKVKHGVNDIDSCCHGPIGFEEVWGMKWWAMHQFKFLCSVDEVNAVHSWARATNEYSMPQLEFHWKRAQQMM